MNGSCSASVSSTGRCRPSPSSTCGMRSPGTVRTWCFSTALQTALAARLERGEQALVLLNRRGLRGPPCSAASAGGSVACPELQRLADAASTGRPRPLPLLRLHGAPPGGLPPLRRAVPRTHRRRDGAYRERGGRPVSHRNGCAARSRYRAAARRAAQRILQRFARRETSTSWSGPRWWPRATTFPR